MEPSRRRVSALMVAACAVLLSDAAPRAGVHLPQASIIFATTTSTQDTGLLDVLVPRFEEGSGVEVKVIAVGTGAALRMGSTGDADVVLVHAPEAEKVYVDSGDLVEGRRVMYNTFVLAGPPEDPAGVRTQRSLRDVMRAIAENGVFISRGDDSGTHKKELALWSAAGIDPQAVKREETGQGMGATLNVADQKGAYVLTDKATYLALRKRLKLAILLEGDPDLRNIYTIYVVNPAKHSKVKAAAARAFADFWVSPEVQAIIGEFRRTEYGEPLFIPDAAAKK
jgi:tungstate transport system substrate-binding protein